MARHRLFTLYLILAAGIAIGKAAMQGGAATETLSLNIYFSIALPSIAIALTRRITAITVIPALTLAILVNWQAALRLVDVEISAILLTFGIRNAFEAPFHLAIPLLSAIPIAVDLIIRERNKNVRFIGIALMVSTYIVATALVSLVYFQIYAGLSAGEKRLVAMAQSLANNPLIAAREICDPLGLSCMRASKNDENYSHILHWQPPRIASSMKRSKGDDSVASTISLNSDHMASISYMSNHVAVSRGTQVIFLDDKNLSQHETARIQRAFYALLCALLAPIWALVFYRVSALYRASIVLRSPAVLLRSRP